MPSDREDGRLAGLSRRDYLKLSGAVGLAGAGGYGAYTLWGQQPSAQLESREELDRYYAGPEGETPEDSPLGTRYFAADTGRELLQTAAGWRPQGFAGPFVDTRELRGIADRIVRSTAELEAAFERLEAGDTIYVAGGIYRPRRWLTVDADGVTILGQSRRDTMIKPADGANVGGIHVGPTDPVENVHIAGVGFHGNDGAMDQSVKRLHAFLVENANHVTIRDCFATRTSPYHEHDAGGSGFTVRSPASHVSIVGNYTRDIGDRSIQVAGSNILIRGNQLTDGFDRAISLEVSHPRGGKRYSRNVTVVNNLGRDNSQGSIVGASQGAPTREGAGNYAIVGNVGYGRHRRLVYLGITEAVRNVAVVGNSGRQADFDEKRAGIYVSGALSNAVIAGNSLEAYTSHGIEVDSTGSGIAVANNVVRAPEDVGIALDARGVSVTGNVVRDAGEGGIVSLQAPVSITGNSVGECGGDGIAVAGGTGVMVSGNTVTGVGRDQNRAAGIQVGTGASLVGTNHVTADNAPGIAVESGTAPNLFVGNLIRSGTTAWAVEGGGHRFVGNSPARTTGTRSREIRGEETRVEFPSPQETRPAIEVVPERPARWGVEWHRDDEGAYRAATVRLDSEGADEPAATVRLRPAAGL